MSACSPLLRRQRPLTRCLMWAGPECRVNCIKGEIHNVIASLRLGWAAQSQFLADFKGLHEQLCEVSPALP